MKRTTPLKRTPFSRNGVLAQSSFQRTAKPKRMKISKPKTTLIRQSAKGEDCSLRFDCCNFDTSTTVWCHSNNYVDGKGMGIKARDEEGCYGCSACHAFYDGGYAVTKKWTRERVESFFNRARKSSQDILRIKGLMK